MKTQHSILLTAATMAGLASAGPLRPYHENHARGLYRREVPQEHSHNFVLDITREFLNLDNPKNIQDPVFGLLGNAAAAAGAGSVTNLDCLKQETADQAFTNAKAAGDLRGMAGALMFQAIERNTGGVGVKSVICNETAVNPEIAALTQHQDPASDGAADSNKAITLELAKQLAAIGADPLLALETGTFAPGDVSFCCILSPPPPVSFDMPLANCFYQPNDNTGKGNSCDTDPNDPGCIFTDKLLVLDATPDEISAAVADVAQTFTGTGGISATHVDFAGLSVAAATGAVTTSAAGNDNNNNNNAAVTTSAANSAATECAAEAAAPASTSSCSTITTTITPSGAAAASTVSDAAATETSSASTGTNVQEFTGTLGGAPPPVISSSGTKPFEVNGDTFVGQGTAISRSCAIQHNACANAANSGSIDASVSDCDAQETACQAFNNLRRRNLMLAEVHARALAKRQASSDFGSCTDPSILFSDSLPDRQGSGFIASNQDDFNHGSALNIGVIASFICQRLSDSCGASADVLANCDTAQTAAKAATQDQSAADAFNNALGVGSGSGSSGSAVTSAPSAAATEPVVMVITQCS